MNVRVNNGPPASSYDKNCELGDGYEGSKENEGVVAAMDRNFCLIFNYTGRWNQQPSVNKAASLHEKENLGELANVME